MELSGEYARLGFYLFPVQPKDKRPFAGFRWREMSSPDLARWEQWLQQYPNCNWAIDLAKSGLFVVDLDMKQGGNGIEDWDFYLEKFSEDLPHTIEVRTPSGGLHILYRNPSGLASYRINANSVEVRGSGAYVLCPPSYQYAHVAGHAPKDCENIPSIPANILALPKYVDRNQSVQIGQRDHTLNARAFHRWNVGDLTVEQFRTWVHAENKTYHPPLSDAQADQKWRNVIKKPPQKNPDASQDELQTSDKGVPDSNLYNAIAALRLDPEYAGKVWFDDFHQNIFLHNRPITDEDFIFIRAHLQKKWGLKKIQHHDTKHAVFALAKKDLRNEATAYLDSLKWDGTPRIEGFFTEYFGADDSLYTCSASENFWIGLAARAYDPGCRLDTMVVLVGKQGAFKSTAVEIVGGKWACAISEKVSNKDFLIAIQGKLVVELEEMDAFKGADISAIKATISRKTDRFRVPFGITSCDHPRRCIFIGTTNKEQFLSDETGGRRFWPIRVGEIKKEALSRHRDQLFAEGVARYKKGGTWHKMPPQTEVVQEEHRHEDDWQEPIATYLILKDETSSREVATECLRMDIQDVKKEVTSRVCKILTVLGFTSKAVRREGMVVKKWLRAVTQVTYVNELSVTRKAE